MLTMALTLKLANVAAAVLGASGTAILFKGSFAYEGFAPYYNEQMISDQTARNTRRRLLQRGGLGLILASFVLQAVAAFLSPL